MMLSSPRHDDWPPLTEPVHGSKDMESPPPSMLDLLYPLSEFFRQGEPRPVARLETGQQTMPEPYRSLLVHGKDMTSTLELFHGEPLRLRLLASQRRGDSLFRRVVLIGRESSKAVELGAIRIHLPAFGEVARQRVLEAQQPLGSILKEFEIAYVSRPRLFFHVASDAAIESALAMDRPARLYGRQNVLSSPDGDAFAEVVEILPPVDDLPASAEENLRDHGG